MDAFKHVYLTLCAAQGERDKRKRKQGQTVRKTAIDSKRDVDRLKDKQTKIHTGNPKSRQTNTVEHISHDRLKGSGKERMDKKQRDITFKNGKTT